MPSNIRYIFELLLKQLPSVVKHKFYLVIQVSDVALIKNQLDQFEGSNLAKWLTILLEIHN